MRTIAIGDIHGCSLALEALVERIEPQPDDQLVFLGDYVDRGPSSRRVMEILVELAAKFQVVGLLGNHEAMLLAALDAGRPNPFWLGQCGGGETLISYGGELSNIPSDHVDFLRGLQRWHEIERCFFVHANYDPDVPLADQSDNFLLWKHLTLFIPNPHVSGKTAIVGHTPQRSFEILNLGHVVCIDTACFAGGWLTAIDVDSGQFWQTNRFGEIRGAAGT